MNAIKAEAIARIQCEFGINGVCVRPVYRGWAVLHVDSLNSCAETIYEAKTKEECDEIIRLAREEVKA